MKQTDPSEPAATDPQSSSSPSADGGDRDLEIAHVLFIDIVGYSKRLLNEQTALVTRLNDIVRNTEQFRKAEAAQKLITIPTGDGMALVFTTAPDAPARCAIEINLADLNDPKIELRMGIHSGPIDRVADVNARENVAGAGINMAQRVMDCGDSGHILVSQRMADDLGQQGKWRSQLHPLGEIEVKHGVRLGIVNLYSDLYGNPNVPEKFRAAQRIEQKQTTRKRLLFGAIAALVAALLLTGGYFFVLHRAEERQRAREARIPAQSVAVLPFENLSPDAADAFLAGGLQDEIITQLSKIGALKVISRTSTLQYGSKPANIRQIAKELGVATILEGSVQKVAKQIRVRVQLIKAATDTPIWTPDAYDRELIDLLQTQSEIAQQVAAALSATLTAQEKEEIERKATSNAEAYALYLKGTEVLRRPAASATRMEEGQHYFEQAIALDPNFALAHARLGQQHTRIAMFYDPSTMHKERGLSEAKEALRLQPNLSEGHVALGLYYGRLSREYDLALKEYELAQRGGPNDVYIVYGIAHVQMRKGQWRAAIANWERATSLDPMNWNMFDNLANAYGSVGMAAAAEKAKKRAAELSSGGPVEKFLMQQSWGWAYYELTGSVEKLEESAARKPAVDDSNGAIASAVFQLNMVKRDFDQAAAAIQNSPASIFESFNGPRCTKKFLLGIAALARGDAERSRPLLEAELPFARSEVAESPDSAVRHLQLGLICAYLGRKEEAIAEGERAVELLPIAKDAFDGPGVAAGLAEIYGRVEEKDKAVALLEKMMSLPGGPSQIVLRDWNWDPLRGDPRFEKLAKGPAPKIVY